jgi:hypothetical protein
MKARLVYEGKDRPYLSKNVDDDLLDWDACVDDYHLPKRSGEIKVKFRYIGESKPMPIVYEDLDYELDY